MLILITADFNALARTYGRIPHSLNQYNFSDGRHGYMNACAKVILILKLILAVDIDLYVAPQEVIE